MRRRPSVPLVILAVCIAVIAVTAVVLFVGGSRVGATWDERAHVGMLQTYFDTGWNVGPDWLVNGELDPFTGKWPYFVYAPVASLLAHAAAVMTGNEPWGAFSASPEAYAARHIATALIALLGVLATGAITWVITRSWRWGILAAALLACVPMWIGHGMFNVKDLPVGTGYTIATLGFVLMCRRDYSRSRRLRVLGWAAVVSGVVLAVGTRPASGLGIALAGLALAAGCLVLMLLARSRTYLRSWGLRARAIDVVGSLVLGYVMLAVIYPKGFINPFRLAKETLLISGRFPVNDAELTNGVWLAQPAPWFYLPTWFGAQLPLLVLAGCLAFIVAWVALIVRLARQHPRRAAALERGVLPMPVMAQLALMPLLAIAVHSTVYDAARQFLFVVPAAAVLASLGIRAVVARVDGRRLLSGLVWALVAVGLALPVVDQIRLFPYTYVYFNEVASLKPIDGNWATDYWRSSGRDLVRLVPPGDTSCVFIDAKHAQQPCDLESTFAPFWADQGLDAKPGVLAAGEYWLVRENNGYVTPPPGCSLQDQITRPLRGQTVTISQVFRCTYPVS